MLTSTSGASWGDPLQACGWSGSMDFKSKWNILYRHPYKGIEYCDNIDVFLDVLISGWTRQDCWNLIFKYQMFREWVQVMVVLDDFVGCVSVCNLARAKQHMNMSYIFSWTIRGDLIKELGVVKYVTKVVDIKLLFLVPTICLKGASYFGSVVYI